MASKAKPIVGRSAEIAYLEQCLATALTGERQVVFVSGEPGIGKTTIVDAFLGGSRNWELGSRTSPPLPDPQSQSAEPGVRVGRGQCIEQYGVGEAFLPLLEIAGQLCRGPQRDQTRELLRRYAPSWLVQLPFLIGAAELEALLRQLQGATRERMLREAAEILTVFTREQGLVLVLEDLHWSDVSTLEWLSYIAQRREPAKLLVIGTYRPTDVLATNHPLRGVVQELTARSRCEELRVTPLSEQSVREYLTCRLNTALATSSLPGLIHRRTGGNPLFVVNLVDDLLQQGLVREEAGQWQVQGELLSVIVSVPETLRQVIERQIERLPAEVQQLLEVASVVGMEFAAAAVAAGLQATVEEIDQQCVRIARQEQFLAAQGAEEWPDGTLSERYNFRHALYHAALYDRLTETQRVRLHRRIAERKEAAYGERVREIAGELAVHFEKGRNYQKAVDYCQLAGAAALQRYARSEAATLLTRGLQVLQGLPDSPARLQQEVELHVTLGNVLIGTKGYAAPETERVYRQAWELCQQVGDTPQRFPVLDGLRHYYAMRGEQRMAYQIEEQLLAFAEQAQDPALMLWAHGSRGVTLLWMGAFVEARTHLESRLALYESYQPRADVPRYGDPAVMGLSHLSLALWMLGYPDQAVQKIQQALALAQQLGDAFSIAYAQTNGGLIYQHRREGAVAQKLSEAAITLATHHGLPFWLAAGLVNRGWTLVEQGQTTEGIREIEQGIQAWRATGAANAEPYFLTLLAEGHAKAGHTAEALTIVAKALARMEQTEERCWEAGLYRLKGEILLTQAINSQQLTVNNQKEEGTKDWGREVGEEQRPASSVQRPASSKTRSQILNPSSYAEAETCFQEALTVSRKQQAKSLELRASMSLARLWQSQGKTDEARQLVEDIYNWFSEGFDTKDLQEAEALLVTLGGRVKTEEEKRTTGRIGERENGREENDDFVPLSPHPPVAPSVSPSQAPTPNTFRDEGDYWTLSFQGTVCRVRQTLGMQYLAHLLHHPHREFHVLVLVSGGAEPAQALVDADRQSNPAQIHHGLSDAGELLDAQAKAAYKRRLQELQAELEEAQTFHDVGRAEKIQEEIEFLTAEISRAVGLGGRRRRAASPAERARVNVTLAIKAALKRITANHPALGQYLARTIKTGYACLYAPEPHQSVVWQF